MADAAGVAVLEPAGDLAGDARAELLWTAASIDDVERDCVGVDAAPVGYCLAEEGTGTVDVAIEVVDGTLRPVWSASADGASDALVYPLGRDLDGDGHSEVVVDALYGDADGITTTLTVLGGATGAPAWSYSTDDLAFAAAFGEYGGTAGDDVLIVTLPFFDDGDVQLRRVDGRDGAVLLTTGQPMLRFPDDELGGGGFLLTYVGGLADADGDAAGDVYGGSVLITFDEEGETTSTRSNAWLEDGARGGTIRGFDRDAEGYQWGTPDLDGDGLSDVVEVDVAEDGGAALHAIRVVDAAALWSAGIDDPWATWAFPAGDLDGVPGAEVIWNDNPVAGGEVTTRTRVTRGADGATLWAVDR